jgi:O-antigen ligase
MYIIVKQVSPKIPLTGWFPNFFLETEETVMTIEKTEALNKAGRWVNTLLILVGFLILFTSIIRLFSWGLAEGFLNYRVPLLLNKLGWVDFGFQLNVNQIVMWVTLLSLYCTILLLLTQIRYLRTRRFWLSAIHLIALLAFTGLSRYWSVAPGFTYSRFNLLLAGALGGILMGFAFEFPRLRKILEIFAIVLIVGSIVLVIAKPEVPTTRIEIKNGVEVAGWLGLFGWKMPFGMMMGFAAVVFFFRLLDFKQQTWPGRIYGLIFFSLSLYMTNKSLSMTEVLAVAAVLFTVLVGAIYLKWGHHLRPVHWWTLGILTVLLVAIIWFERGFFFGLIGKGENLTGRLPLWISLIPAIQERFWFGYGFGEAFWKNSIYYQPIWDQFPEFLPVFAHNGFIEALMDTGIVGLVLWLIFLVQVAYLTLRHFFHKRTLLSLFYFSWVVYMVVMNIANNHLGSYETFTWLMLVIAFASMVREDIDRVILPIKTQNS